MLKNLLTFDELITPKIINIVYWLSIAIYIILGLVSMISGGFMGFIAGILVIVVGALFSRIGCEMMLIAFKIHDQLKSINENTTKN